MILFAILSIFNLPITILAKFLAPILPIFAGNAYGWCDNHSYEAFEPRLPNWMGWLQTPDNSLYGDATFQQLHPKGNYWSMVGWLWRNPAYSFGMRYLTNPYYTQVKGDKTIKDNDNAKEGWCFVRANGLFQLRIVKRIYGSSRCIYCNFGWNVMGLVDDNVNPKPNTWQATFVFSPRLSGYR